MDCFFFNQAVHMGKNNEGPEGDNCFSKKEQKGCWRLFFKKNKTKQTSVFMLLDAYTGKKEKTMINEREKF